MPEVAIVNDDTGQRYIKDYDDAEAISAVQIPFVDYQHGGFGVTLFYPSGLRDSQGRRIFRTSAGPETLLFVQLLQRSGSRFI